MNSITRIQISSSVIIVVSMLAISLLLVVPVVLYRVPVDSKANKITGGFLFMDFPATRFLTPATWASSVAPRLMGQVTTLYMFSIASSLLSPTTGTSPTPYQLALMIALSGGGMSQLWKYIHYHYRIHGRRDMGTPTSLTGLFLVIFIFQIFGLFITALDTFLHHTTTSVPFEYSVKHPEILSSFGQRITSSCLPGNEAHGIGVGGVVPCTWLRFVHSSDFAKSSDMVATLRGFSKSHQLYNVTYSNNRETASEAIILGPVRSSIPDGLSFTANTIGVSTACQPISRRCDLTSTSGAATNFRCSPALSGNLQVPEINTSAYYWHTRFSSTTNSIMYGAEFLDWNLSSPYVGYDQASALLYGPPMSEAEFLDWDMSNPDVGYDQKSAVPRRRPFPMLNSFHLAVVVRMNVGADPSRLRHDPEITLPVGGGMAFILGCNVTTLNVTYSFQAGALSVLSATQTPGYVTWLYNAVLGGYGSLAHLSQGIDIAAAADSAASLAKTWSRFYSEQAVAILATACEAQPNLDESNVRTLILTRVSGLALWLLVAFTGLFATLGGLLGFKAVKESRENSQGIPAISAVYQGLGVEGLVATKFETSEGMVENVSLVDCFEEMTHPVDRVALRKRENSRWTFQRS